jgi:hypothetical protein
LRQPPDVPSWIGGACLAVWDTPPPPPGLPLKATIGSVSRARTATPSIRPLRRTTACAAPGLSSFTSTMIATSPSSARPVAVPMTSGWPMR